MSQPNDESTDAPASVDYPPEPVPSSAQAWWMECFPQWKGKKP